MTVRVRRFDCLDGYRALAALSVLVFHVNAATGANTTNTAGWILARLDVGVSVFFTLSGFLLYRPFALAHLRGRPRPDTRRYFTRRFVRIFPAYWVTLFVVTTVFRNLSIHNLGDAAIFGLLLTGYSVKHLFAGGLFQAWTLTVEVAFYCFLPLYAWLVARRADTAKSRVRTQTLGVGVLLCIGLGSRAAFAAHRPGALILLSLPTHLAPFALGMSLAIASAWGEATGQIPRVLALAARHTVVCWMLAALAFWAAATQLGLSRHLTFTLLTFRQEMGRHILFALFAFFFLLPGVLPPGEGAGPQGLGRRALASRPLAAVGLVSYGIYLWHYDLIKELTRGQEHASFATVLWVALAVSAAFATVSYVVVEAPLMRLVRRK